MENKELHWANNENYSAKILIFENEGFRTQTMLHSKTSKTWFVNSGNFILKIIDTKTGTQEVHEIGDGKTIHFHPLSPHSLEVIIPGTITEVATSDPNTDLYILG